MWTLAHAVNNCISTTVIVMARAIAKIRKFISNFTTSEVNYLSPKSILSHVIIVILSIRLNSGNAIGNNDSNFSPISVFKSK